MGDNIHSINTLHLQLNLGKWQSAYLCLHGSPKLLIFSFQHSLIFSQLIHHVCLFDIKKMFSKKIVHHMKGKSFDDDVTKKMAATWLLWDHPCVWLADTLSSEIPAWPGTKSLQRRVDQGEWGPELKHMPNLRSHPHQQTPLPQHKKQSSRDHQEDNSVATGGGEVTTVIPNLTVGPDGYRGWAIYIGLGGANFQEALTYCGNWQSKSSRQVWTHAYWEN